MNTAPFTAPKKANRAKARVLVILCALMAPWILPWTTAVAAGNLQPYPGSDLPPDPAVVIDQLPTGLTYAVMPNNEPPGRVSLRLLIRAGSLNERNDQRGLAHYLEHMAFKGTENFAPGTLVEYFQNLGMSFGPDANAYTGFDRTVYQIDVPDTNPESIAEALMVLRDFADRMIIPATEVESERGVILSEKRTRDSIAFRTAKAEFAFLLPDAIISDRFPIGITNVIINADSEQLREFYDAWYRPELAAVIVAGDIEADIVTPLIQERFGDFKPRAPMPGMPDPGNISDTRGFAVAMHPEPEAPATRIAIQSVQPLQTLPDTLARRREELARAVAMQMLSRRLETLARQEDAPFNRGWATSRDYFELFRNASIDLITQPDNWARALAIAENELRRALTHGFQESELREIRAEKINRLETRSRRSATRRSRNLAEALVATLTTGRVFMHPQTELEKLGPFLENLTVDQCLNALRQAFPETNRLVFVSGNLELDDLETAIRQTYQAAAETAVKPPEAAPDLKFAYESPDRHAGILRRRHIADLDIHQVEFDNHVRLNIKQTGFASNEVIVAVRIGSGQLTEPQETPGLARLASATLIQGGLQAHSADEMRRIFAGRNVGWRFSVEPDAFVFRGNTTPDDLELQLQLLRAYLKAPGFRPEALRHARDNFEEQYINARHTARGILNDRAAHYLAGNDPRFGLPPADKLMAWELHDVSDWLREPLLRDTLEISIVGDVHTITGAIDIAAATLGALPARRTEKPDFRERRRVSRPEPGALKNFEFSSAIPSGYSAVYWPAPDQWNMPRTRRLNILARVFTDRMRLRFREDAGEAYSAHAIYRPCDTYRNYGWFYGIVAIAPADAAETSAAIEAIARDLYTGTIGADEHQRALRPVLSSLRDTLRDNRYWLNSVLISAWEHPQRLEWARNMSADFEAVTAGELEALARKYLDPEKALRIHVIPRS